MSWMDTWSRPSKSQAVPAPFYLLPNGASTPYCRTCGRVISSRKTTAASKSTSQAQAAEVKYCSARCRGQKPGKLDRGIEQAFVRLLEGEDEDEEVSRVKGDVRRLVPCEVVERRVFGERRDPEKRFGRRKNRASRVVVGGHDDEDGGPGVSRHSWRGEYGSGYGVGDEELELHPPVAEDLDPSVMASMSVRSGTRVRPPQTRSQVNGSVGGEKGKAERIEETDEMREKRAEGQKKAHEREMVRCAARRGVVFGFVIDGEQRRKCEAVVQGKVVEPSFAKGDWAVRWRDE